MTAANSPNPPEQRVRASDLEAAVAAALDSPEFGSLPLDIQAALRSHNREENLTGLWEFARLRALRSPHFGDLADWARETFIENDTELMPAALRELNRIGSEMSSAPSDRVFEIVELAERHDQELMLEEPEGQEWSTVGEEIERQSRQVGTPRESPAIPALPALPQSPTSEQAIGWLKDILARRRDVVEPGNDPYHIPHECLSIQGTRATGPSIVEGDAPVTFRYLEPMGQDLVAVYGSRGTKLGYDMPLVSKDLMAQIKRALGYLPGYTETCWTSGEPLTQPLYFIARKLLKGEIKRVEDIRFWRESPEAKRRRIEEELTAVKSSPDRPPVEKTLPEKLGFSIPFTPQMLESSLRLRGEILRMSQNPSAQPL